MAFIPISDTMKVALEYSLNGQLLVNVYHVASPDPIVSADLTGIAAVFVSWWSVNMRQNFSTALSLNRVVVTDMTDEGGEQVDYVTGLPSLGTISSAVAPNNVAVCTSLRTGFSGRSNRGRKYWGGIVSAEVSDNFISTTLAAAILADMVSLDAAISSAGFSLVVASLYHDHAPRTAGVTREVTSFIQDLRVDTQRRRLPLEGT